MLAFNLNDKYLPYEFQIYSVKYKSRDRRDSFHLVIIFYILI